MSNVSDQRKVFVDLEYIFPEMGWKYGQPKGHEKFEIIQIAAIVFDLDQRHEIAHVDLLCHPESGTKLPEFFTELTAITQQDIDVQALKLETAVDQFVNFCEKYEVMTYNNVYNVFLKNVSYISDNKFPLKPFTRVKPIIENYGISTENVSSGELYKLFNIDLGGHIHNALHDVRSMAHSLAYLEKRSRSIV